MFLKQKALSLYCPCHFQNICKDSSDYVPFELFFRASSSCPRLSDVTLLLSFLVSVSLPACCTQEYLSLAGSWRWHTHGIVLPKLDLDLSTINGICSCHCGMCSCHVKIQIKTTILCVEYDHSHEKIVCLCIYLFAEKIQQILNSGLSDFRPFYFCSRLFIKLLQWDQKIVIRMTAERIYLFFQISSHAPPPHFQKEEF